MLLTLALLGLGCSSEEPSEPAAFWSSDSGWKAVAAGISHTCAIDSSDALHCWGQTGAEPYEDPTDAPLSL